MYNCNAPSLYFQTTFIEKLMEMWDAGEIKIYM